LDTQIHLRRNLVGRHNQIVASVAAEFRRLGFDCIRSGYEAGGGWFDPDLFVKTRHEQLGFYLELKTPQRERIAIDLDEWLHFRVLRDVVVLAVWADGQCAVVDVDRDRPTFWGAAADDRIPVLAADQLRMLDVPLQLFERGDPSYTSSKPFIIYRPNRQFNSLREAIEFVVGIKAGGLGEQP
jgi:hypothetical protein